MDWLLWLGCLFDYVGPSGNELHLRIVTLHKCHSPVCNTVYNTTKQPLDGKDMYEIEAESFTAARPKALVSDDLGMRLNNQLCFPRVTNCMFEVGRALMGGNMSLHVFFSFYSSGDFIIVECCSYICFLLSAHYSEWTCFIMYFTLSLSFPLITSQAKNNRFDLTCWKLLSVTYFDAPIRNRLQVFGCLVAVVV